MELLRNCFKEEDTQLLKPRTLLLQRTNKRKTYQKTDKVDNRPSIQKKRRSTRLLKLQRHWPTEYSRKSFQQIDTKRNETVC